MEEIRMEEVKESEEAILPEEPAEADRAHYEQEVQALYAARPELRGEELPDEVLQACVRGKALTEAYNDFARRQRQDAAALRRENRILRQNARAAAPAPVRGVTRGGGVASQPEDAFLRGFNAEW